MSWLRYSVVLISCLACCERALALDPLLVEFGWSQPNPVTLPANYVALLGGDTWNDGPGVQIISQYPTTEYADSIGVALWNHDCANGSACSVAFANGDQSAFPGGGEPLLDEVLGGPNHLWADGWDGNSQPFPGSLGTWHAATYVPQKGNGNQALYGYMITAVERDITATTQTIRLYGVDAPIPEPSSLLLALLGCAAFLSCRSCWSRL